VIPAGYTFLRRRGVRVLVRHDAVTRLGAWLAAPALEVPAGAEALAGGRGGAFRLGAPGDLRLVVRPCRRGGWVGRVVRRTYLGWPPRPWRELAVSIAARARAVPTPSIVAVRVSGCGIYRGAVVTEEVPDAVTAAEVLRGAQFATCRDEMARAAGSAVGRLHAAGIEHADLNLANILLSRRDPTAPAFVIDLDGARLADAPLDAAARQRNLQRLGRSWRRLMDGAAVPPELRSAFAQGYEAVDGSRCAC
jgi:3-deoxy-D-manno-octulosonic acid kinase